MLIARLALTPRDSADACKIETSEDELLILLLIRLPENLWLHPPFCPADSSIPDTHTDL